jgi:hypothetical protein
VPCTTIGWPYTAPSSRALHPLRNARGVGNPATQPARSLPPWYVGQSVSGPAAPGVCAVLGVAEPGADAGGVADPGSCRAVASEPHAATATATEATAAPNQNLFTSLMLPAALAAQWLRLEGDRF